MTIAIWSIAAIATVTWERSIPRGPTLVCVEPWTLGVLSIIQVSIAVVSGAVIHCTRLVLLLQRALGGHWWVGCNMVLVDSSERHRAHDAWHVRECRPLVLVFLLAVAEWCSNCCGWPCWTDVAHHRRVRPIVHVTRLVVHAAD